METVIIIDECNHGTIGVAKTMRGAMDFLIKKDWISKYENVWVEEKDDYDMVINVFGENWGETNETRKYMCQICPELILQENLQGLNSGVSVILV